MKLLNNTFPFLKLCLTITCVAFLILFIFWNNIYDAHTLGNDIRIDKIEIIKSARTLKIYQQENKQWKMLKEYNIALGKNPVGHKAAEGDNKTPEGHYFISRKNSKSTFYLSLEISYPHANDTAQALAQGLKPGGNIMIHGLFSGLGWIGKIHTLKDWTKGCIAVTSKEIHEIFAYTSVGTPVIIKP